MDPPLPHPIGMVCYYSGGWSVVGWWSGRDSLLIVVLRQLSFMININLITL